MEALERATGGGENSRDRIQDLIQEVVQFYECKCSNEGRPTFALNFSVTI